MNNNINNTSAPAPVAPAVQPIETKKTEEQPIPPQEPKNNKLIIIILAIVGVFILLMIAVIVVIILKNGGAGNNETTTTTTTQATTIQMTTRPNTTTQQRTTTTAGASTEVTTSFKVGGYEFQIPVGYKAYQYSDNSVTIESINPQVYYSIIYVEQSIDDSKQEIEDTIADAQADGYKFVSAEQRGVGERVYYIYNLELDDFNDEFNCAYIVTNLGYGSVEMMVLYEKNITPDEMLSTLSVMLDSGKAVSSFAPGDNNSKKKFSVKDVDRIDNKIIKKEN